MRVLSRVTNPIDVSLKQLASLQPRVEPSEFGGLGRLVTLGYAIEHILNPLYKLLKILWGVTL